MDDGRVHWARSGGADIAYRLVGDGPVDLVFVSGLNSHIDALLEEPSLRRWWERLGSIARIVLVDGSGSGPSDRLTGPVSLEEEVDDLIAVLDHAGVDRVVLQSYAAGGPLAVAFAARRPERTLALVLYASVLANSRNEDMPWAATPEERDARFARLIENWGTGSNLDTMAPSVADDVRLREWLGRLERLSCTPAGVLRLAESFATHDVRPLLPSLR